MRLSHFATEPYYPTAELKDITRHPSTTLLRPLTQKISPAQTMANIAGYTIIRNAVRSELALKAAEIVPGNLAVTVKREKYTEFEVPRICLDIQAEFIKAS